MLSRSKFLQKCCLKSNYMNVNIVSSTLKTHMITFNNDNILARGTKVIFFTPMWCLFLLLPCEFLLQCDENGHL